MLEIKLYQIPILEYGKRNTIKFDTENELKAFFNGIINQTTLTLQPDHIPNLWKLDNEITIFDEGRTPFVNYNYVSVDMEHFFFIVDFEELGNNQIKYKLRKDTLMSYVTCPSPAVNVENRKALILREHKPRFDFSTNKPIYDKEIEDLSITPEIVTEEQKKSPDRCRLILRKYGGGVDNNQKVLSKVKYLWEIYGYNPKSVTMANSTFKDIKLGWGFSSAVGNQDLTVLIQKDNGDFDSIDFATLPSTIYIRFVKSNNEYYLEARSKSNNELTSLSGIISYNPSNVTLVSTGIYNLKLVKKDDQLVILTCINQMFEVYYDMGMDLTTPNSFYFKIAFGKYSNNAWTLPTISRIDQGDPLNSKIIELPYFSTSFLNDAVNSYAWGIQGKSIAFEVLSNISLDDITLNMFTKNYDYSKVDKQKVAYNEPKLYTSQFMPYLLAWYNETLLLRRESTPDNQLTLKTKLNESDYSKMSITISGNYDEKTPYEVSKVINLNNEVASVSSDIDTYMRYLYDNDQKMIQLQEKQASRNLAQSSVNQITGIGVGVVGGMMTGNPVGAAVGGISGVVRAGVNMGFEIAKHNNAKEQRRAEYQNKIMAMQTSMINIAGGSPELYHNNDIDAVKVFSIKPTTKHLDYLDWYFHKYGYQTLELKNPTLRTRLYFDYKQMIIDEITTDTVNEETKIDIRNRFAEGITIYHMKNIKKTGQFDTPFMNGDSIPIDNEFIKNNINNITKIEKNGVSYPFIINQYEITIYYMPFDIILDVLNDSVYYAIDGDLSGMLEITFSYIDLEQEKENWEV